MYQQHNLVVQISVILHVLICLKCNKYFLQGTFYTEIFIVFPLELTINQTKIDESGIRFPEISTNNVSGNSEQIPTFLELPKQDTKSEKGMD